VSRYRLVNFVKPKGKKWKTIYHALTLRLTDRIYDYISNRIDLIDPTLPKCVLLPHIRDKINHFLHEVISNLNELPFDLVAIYEYLKSYNDAAYIICIVTHIFRVTGIPIPEYIRNELNDKYGSDHICDDMDHHNMVRKLPPIYSMKYIVLHKLLADLISLCLADRNTNQNPFVVTTHKLYKSTLQHPVYNRYIPLVPIICISIRLKENTPAQYFEMVNQIFATHWVTQGSCIDLFKGYTFASNETKAFLSYITVCIVYAELIFDFRKYRTVRLNHKSIAKTLSVLKPKFKGVIPVKLRDNSIKSLQFIFIRGILRRAYYLNDHSTQNISYDTIIESVTPSNSYIGEFVEKYVYATTRNDRIP